MCFCLRNIWSRISHNMSMTHAQPDVLPIQPIMSMIILQLIYYIIVINSHNISYMLIMIFRKSGLTRLLSCLLSGYTSCYTILKPSFNPLMFCFRSIDLRNAPRTPHQAPQAPAPEPKFCAPRALHGPQKGRGPPKVQRTHRHYPVKP